MLASFGGVVSLVVASLGVAMLSSVQSDGLLANQATSGIQTGSLQAIQLDLRALLFTALVSMATGVLFGLAPALQSTRLSLSDALASESATSGRRVRRRFDARQALTVVEIALAVVLLAGSGLLVKSFARLVGVRPGFEPGHVLTMRANRAPDWSLDSIGRFYDVALERLARLPGVTDVAIGDCPPTLGGCSPQTNIRLLDRPPATGGNEPVFGMHWITPMWTTVMRVPLVRGRLFTTNDRPNTPKVALINEAAARAYWPGVDPIGRNAESPRHRHRIHRGRGWRRSLSLDRLAGGPRHLRAVPSTAPERANDVLHSHDRRSGFARHERATGAQGSRAGISRPRRANDAGDRRGFVRDGPLHGDARRLVCRVRARACDAGRVWGRVVRRHAAPAGNRRSRCARCDGARCRGVGRAAGHGAGRRRRRDRSRRRAGRHATAPRAVVRRRALRSAHAPQHRRALVARRPRRELGSGVPGRQRSARSTPFAGVERIIMAHPSFEPILRPRLSDELVSRIVSSVRDGRLTRGDRMPSITEMARRFRVAPATVREALVKLELMCVVEVRHGAGVYVRGSTGS